MFQVTRLLFELFILSVLLLDLTLHLLKLVSDVLSALFGILVEGLDLVLETLFDVLILFDVLLHDDLLSLLGHSIKLDVHSALLEVNNLQVLDLRLSLVKLELGLSV